MNTAATIFSGGGGADIGLSNAGLSVRWGIEYDDDIATVAWENDLPIRTGDVTEEDPSDYESVDVLHASPPCPNFSVAKTGAEETDEDVSLARATVKFIRGIDPTLFTLENVWGYRKSQSWKLIREHLQRSGYDWNAWKLNAASYGVPQTRKRMIVAARKGGPRPKKPTPTHAEDPQNGGLFGKEKDQWIGWYEAIEDLIDDLPETELADWQKERLTDVLPTCAVGAGGFDGECVSRDAGNPLFAVTANRNQKDQLRAVLVSGDSVDGEHPAQRRNGFPSVGVGQNSRNVRAVLIPGGNASGDVLRYSDSRTVTVFASETPPRSVLSRRVVQMTSRCLARFQTFPDEYSLPDTKSLACRIIGNAVPPLLMQRCVEAWT